jgi:hypothetical protein
MFLVLIVSSYFSHQHFYSHVKSSAQVDAKRIIYAISSYARLCSDNGSQNCTAKVKSYISKYPKRYYGFLITAADSDGVSSVLLDNRRYKDNERKVTVKVEQKIESLGQLLTVTINSVPSISSAVVNDLTFSLFDGKPFSWKVIKGRSLNSSIFLLLISALAIYIRKTTVLKRRITEYHENNESLYQAIVAKNNKELEFQSKLNQLETQNKSNSKIERQKLTKKYESEIFSLSEDVETLEIKNSNLLKTIPSKDRLEELEDAESKYKQIQTLWTNESIQKKSNAEALVDEKLPFVMSQALMSFEKIIANRVSELGLRIHKHKLKSLNLDENIKHLYGDPPDNIKRIVEARRQWTQFGLIPQQAARVSIFKFLKENRVNKFKEYVSPESFLQIRDDYSKSHGGAGHRQLERGVKILETKDQLNQYLFSYGSMHTEKMNFICKEFFNNESIEESKIQIIDYGCGQGIASIVLLNCLNQQQVKIDLIDDIVLIEPSRIALSRAYYFLKDTSTVVTIEKKLDQLKAVDLKTNELSIKFHLFSNILDMGDDEFDIHNLADKIKNSQKGVNYFLCVSPREKQKLNKFMMCFDNYHEISVSQGVSPFVENKDWQITYNIFKVEL